MRERPAAVTTCALHTTEEHAPTGEPVRFALDGVRYEARLCADHAAALRRSLALFVGHARRAGRR